MQTTSKTAALKQAVNESSMYRFGDGWEVSTWDESCNAHRVGNPTGYYKAREQLTVWRAVRAAELMGIAEGDDIYQVEHLAESTTGTARERLAYILKRLAK